MRCHFWRPPNLRAGASALGARIWKDPLGDGIHYRGLCAAQNIFCYAETQRFVAVICSALSASKETLRELDALNEGTPERLVFVVVSGSYVFTQWSPTSHTLLFEISTPRSLFNLLGVTEFINKTMGGCMSDMNAQAKRLYLIMLFHWPTAYLCWPSCGLLSHQAEQGSGHVEGGA
jgi:hypothetical protein